GGREDERLRLLTLAGTQLAQPLDRAAESELRAAEPFDEVAAPARTERLQRTQLAVHGSVAARDSFTAHAVAGDDALAFQQQLGERAPLGLSREQARGERPAALRRRRPHGTRTGEAARPPVRPRRLVPALGA